MREFVTTASSVTAGHPDKLCDQISDAVLDACLAQGHRAGLVAETAISANIVFLSVRSGADISVDAAAIARRILEETGYCGEGTTPPSVIFDHVVSPHLSETAISSECAQHFATGFGYACADGPGAMPHAIALAHRLTKAMDATRLRGALDALVSDAETHAAVRYSGGGAREVLKLGVRARVSSPDRRGDAEAALRQLAGDVLARTAPDLVQDRDSAVLVQLGDGPSGLSRHAGQTGRKLADDTYGGFVRTSSSALSGKDPSRIDRSANYAARHAARCLVAAGLARECEVQLCYIPGDVHPISVSVDSFETGREADDALARRLVAAFDFSPLGIARRFGLWDLPGGNGGRFYRDLACHGQIGRTDIPCPWEAVEDAALLR